MKIFFALLVGILLGAVSFSQYNEKIKQRASVYAASSANVVGNKEQSSQKDSKQSIYYSALVRSTSTLVTNNAGFSAEIPGLNIKLVSENGGLFLYRLNDTFLYIGIKMRPVVGFDRGVTYVYQLNLKDKKVISLYKPNAYVADISPDDTLVAYALYEPTYKLVIKNLKDNTEKNYPVSGKYEQYIEGDNPWKFGDVHFSPNSKQLAYATLEYEAAVNNDEILSDALGILKIIDLVPNLESGSRDYQSVSPSKRGLVRVYGWQDDKTINYTEAPFHYIEEGSVWGKLKSVPYEGCESGKDSYIPQKWSNEEISVILH